MNLQTRFQPGDPVYFHRDGYMFPALVTAVQIEVAKDAVGKLETAVRYCFNVPPYVLKEEECYAKAEPIPAAVRGYR